MWRAWGNKPVNSTQAITTDPTTSAIIAELLPSELGSTAWVSGKPYQVTWIVGASTSALFRLEQCLSSGLGSTAIRDVRTILTSPGQSPQYVLSYYLEQGDRLRVRVNSSFTGSAIGTISAEPML